MWASKEKSFGREDGERIHWVRNKNSERYPSMLDENFRFEGEEKEKFQSQITILLSDEPVTFVHQ